MLFMAEKKQVGYVLPADFLLRSTCARCLTPQGGRRVAQ
jgi:hypothetical protein